MPAGRPTKLTPELIEKAKTYLPTCYTQPVTTDRGALSYTNVNLPTIVGLARFLEIDKDTVYAWCSEAGNGKTGCDMDNPDIEPCETCHRQVLYNEFSDIVNVVEDEQEKWLINYTAGGLYQPKLSAMLLAKRGYAEKTETDITSKGEQITSTVLPEVIAEADRILKEKKLNG